MILLQEKLDVTSKKRSNLFNWRGQFTPEFVEYILKSFANKGDHILDPFSGSGTVLQEAANLGYEATGFEINPSAYAMSKFFAFCNLSLKERNDFCDLFASKLEGSIDNYVNKMVFVVNEDYRLAYLNLLEFARDFDSCIASKQERILLMNILFQSEKDKNLAVAASIQKSFAFVRKCLLGLPFSKMPINARLMDARVCGLELQNKIDLIVTSPPYINVFNYHQNYRAIIESFNFDILRVAHSEFGSNRKNRGNRFKTVIQYCVDMELAIRSFWIALRQNAKMVLVVGRESNVRGTAFYNGKLVMEIIEQLGGFSDVRVLERQFLNKYGINIVEDIIICTKTKDLTNLLCGKTIAELHLRHSLLSCKEEVRNDILDAIATINEVNESPIFDPKFVVSK